MGLPRFAQAYCDAIERFKENKYSKALLKDSVYDQVIREADVLLELLSKFNQSELAQRQLSGMRSVAYARPSAGTRHDSTTMDKACQELHDWLSKESLFRSFMSYLAGGGCYWSAYAHERAIRCFVSVGNGTQRDIANAMTARGTLEGSSGAVSSVGSMSALERIR